MKKNIFYFVLGSICTLVITVGAAIVMKANEVSFTSTNENWKVNDVQSALEDLYNNRKIMLYDKGDENESLTGGWGLKRTYTNEYYTMTTCNDQNCFEGEGSYTHTTVEKNADNIYMAASHPGSSGYGYGYAMTTTNKKIDVSNHDLIILKGNYQSSRSDFSILRLALLDDDNKEILIKYCYADQNNSYLMDISNVTGNYYLNLSINSSATGGVSGSLRIDQLMMY